MSQNDALSRLKAGPTSMRLGQLFRIRQRMAIQIANLAELHERPSLEWDKKQEGAAPDPVVLMCNELPMTPYGRIGLYYSELGEVPRFSKLMRKKNAFDSTLEAGLDAATDTYSNSKRWIPGFLFEANQETYVYTAYDAIDRVSALTLRVKKQVRFIYCLQDLFLATKAIDDNNTGTRPGS